MIRSSDFCQTFSDLDPSQVAQRLYYLWQHDPTDVCVRRVAVAKISQNGNVQLQAPPQPFAETSAENAVLEIGRFVTGVSNSL